MRALQIAATLALTGCAAPALKSVRVDDAKIEAKNDARNVGRFTEGTFSVQTDGPIFHTDATAEGASTIGAAPIGVVSVDQKGRIVLTNSQDVVIGNLRISYGPEQPIQQIEIEGFEGRGSAVIAELTKQLPELTKRALSMDAAARDAFIEQVRQNNATLGALLEAVVSVVTPLTRGAP